MSPMLSISKIRFVGTRQKTKCQTMLEYAVIIACVVAGLIGMQIYMKRSIQGRVKSAADTISGGGQFSLGHSRGSVVINRDSEYKTVTNMVDADDRIITDTETTLVADQESTRTNLQIDAGESLF